MGSWACVVRVCVVVMLCRANAAHAQVVLNELLPDPAGRDAGREFVELYNPSEVSVSLSGAVLEVWHGARRGWVRDRKSVV